MLLAPRSSYFSSDADDSAEESVFPDANGERQQQGGDVALNDHHIAVHTSPKHTEFPLTTYVLWDRSPLAPPSYSTCVGALPALQLSPECIASLLSTMNAQQRGEESLVLRATLAASTLPQQPGTAAYMLCLLPLGADDHTGDVGQDYSSLSVPVSVRPFGADVTSALSFEQESSVNLVRNLERQICAGRNHALRSCLRVRAAGFISGNSPQRQMQGTLRFEAIFPNESFQFLRIRQPPLLSTPLSMKLTSLVASPPSSSSALARPRMGYLTLNKTRKVVPLLETDPAASLAPLVGIWVSVDALPGRPDEPWLNPFVHGACVRFLKDGKVRERVLVDEDTFLMANFSATGVEYFEVTRLPRTQGGQGGLDFAAADFLLDLSLDAGLAGMPQTVLGRFKPSRHGPGPTEATNPAASIVPPRVMSRPYGEAQALRLGPADTEYSECSEMATPVPRDRVPIPTHVPLADPVLSASEPYLQGPGALRSSLSLSQSDGTQSNRSSLESFRSAQLMRLPVDDTAGQDVVGCEVRPASSPRTWPTNLHVETETGTEEVRPDDDDGERIDGERSDEYEEEELDMAANMLAVYLGVDVLAEPKLVELVRQALLNLPPGWELGISDEEGCYGIPFYLHTATETSVWLHPQEELLRRMIDEARAGRQIRQQRLRRRRRRSQEEGGGGEVGDKDEEDEDEDEEDDEEEEDEDAEDEDEDEEDDEDNEDDEDEDDEVEDPLLSAPPMVLVLDDTNLRLSTELRRLHFPTNPLASLAPSMPVLRPGGDEDSLLMEAGLWGSSRLSSVASSMESDAFFEETAIR